jgi:FixJ family two-component response regulator
VNPHDSIVFIVDDDRRICEALSELLSTFDLHVVTFDDENDGVMWIHSEAPRDRQRC